MINFKIPSIIDGYKIEEQIGSGGNSFVYKALKDGELFAIKILKKILKGVNKQRFENEVEFQMRTRNRNIVSIISRGKVKIDVAGKTRNREYYVMPLYESSFRDIIDAEKDYEHLIRLYLDICNALSFIHNYSKGTIIHRDIKPENFLYDKKHDRLLLSDFGIACFNKPNQIKTGDAKIGNFPYSAPEQRKLKNKKYGTYTDIFAMGLILNEIFTKQIPNGDDYIKISSVNPLFYEFDNIVATMLKNSIDEREYNINDIANKIQYVFDKVKKNYEEIDGEYYDKLKQINCNDLRRIIRNDLCLIYTYLPIIKNYQKTFNHRYHTNIIYSYTNNFSESLRLIKIYELVKHKFDYESNSVHLDSLEKIDANCNEPFVKLREILCGVKAFRDLNYLKGQTIKLFVTLEEYHQFEVIRDIVQIYIEDSPRIYDAFQDLCTLDKYSPIYDEIALSCFIDISDKSSLDDNMINDFLEIIDETKIKKLKEIYRKYYITINEHRYYVLMICKDKSNLPMIMDAIEKELKNNPSYVEEGDLIDAKRTIKSLQEHGNAKCDYYVFENVIVDKVLKKAW